MVIGKAYRPRAFQGKTGPQLGFYYLHNAKAWMTAVLYQEFLRQWDQELSNQNRQILLLQDNFSAHIPPPDLRFIRVENLAANMTSHVQPMDAGVIRNFKAHYRSLFIRRAIDRYDQGITPSDIYCIDQLEAMRLAEVAWQLVDASTIKHCWIKSGIIPENFYQAHIANIAIPISTLIQVRDPLLDAEHEVERALDVLEKTGVLQRENRTSLEALLNPVEEQDIVEVCSDMDIFKAVMRDTEGRETSGMDDGEEEVAADIPQPSRAEALSAVGTLQRYLSPMDNPFARKLEAVLASFGRQTRLEDVESMRDSSITDYFTRK